MIASHSACIICLLHDRTWLHEEARVVDLGVLPLVIETIVLNRWVEELIVRVARLVGSANTVIT